MVRRRGSADSLLVPLVGVTAAPSVLLAFRNVAGARVTDLAGALPPGRALTADVVRRQCSAWPSRPAGIPRRS